MDENRRKKGTTAKQLWTNAEKRKNELKKGVQNWRTAERGSEEGEGQAKKAVADKGEQTVDKGRKTSKGGGGLMDKGEKMEDK